MARGSKTVTVAPVSGSVSSTRSDFEPVFGGHSAYGGHRAPRDHTISFRLRDQWGKYHSNVVWVLPEHLDLLTVANVRKLVANANGTGRKRRK